MVLSEKDGQLFYELWLPLLDYVNEKYKVNKELKNMANSRMLNPVEVKEVADVLWGHVDVIDQYLEECGVGMPDDHKQIVSNWKYCLPGKFVLERNLKKGSIFISGESENVYQVQGIISSFEEMFPYEPLPVLMEATLIPFRDVIITDGLVMAYPVVIGNNMKKQFKEIYMAAKNRGDIIRTLGEMQKTEVKEKKSDFPDKVVDLQRKRAELQKKTNVRNGGWKGFRKLVDKCYDNMIGANTDDSCWGQAFEQLKEIVFEERQKNPDYALRLDLLDDVTDYKYDVQGWMEDCLDEMDLRGDQEDLLKMCDDLLTLFAWPGYSGSDIKFKKVCTLGAMGRKDEAKQFCEDWLQTEPENVIAATAGIYVYIDTRELDAAEALVKQFIKKGTECTEDNDIIFTAASALYCVMGRSKDQKRIDRAIFRYEEKLKEYFLGGDVDEFDESLLEFLEDGELPFY